MTLEFQIVKLLLDGGACDVGMSSPEDGPANLKYAISFVVPLSEAIVDQIEHSPTYSYFHHYRTVNALIDMLSLKTGLLLQKNGYLYMPIGASQSQPKAGQRTHEGLYSHKKAAVLGGLGTIGKSALFLHRKYGPRVRLGTIFTDYEFSEVKHDLSSESVCGSCDLCRASCPTGAIKGNEWFPGCEREFIVDAWSCNDYMREHFMKIGRGSVCGICMSVCPYGQKQH